MREFLELRNCLERWLREAVELIGPAAAVKQEGIPSWTVDEDGVMRYRSRAEQLWDPSVRNQLLALPSAAAVLDVIHADDVLARTFENMIGNGLSAFRLERESALVAMLGPATQAAAKESILSGFEERYRVLADILNGRSNQEYVSLWIISGVHLDGAPIWLDDNIALDHLSDDELAHAADFGLTPKPFPHVALMTSEHYNSFRTCLRLRTQLPQTMGVPDPDSASRFQDRINDHERRLLATLSLVGLTSVRILGYMGWCGDSTFRGISWQYRKIHDLPRWPDNKPLSTELIAMVKDAWSVLRDVPRERYGRALDLALRRMSYVHDRARPDDKILDLMIAAETLYLAEIGNEKARGELSHRLALRSALWERRSGGSTADARATYKLMRSAYDARSLVAHGGAIDGKRYDVGGNSVGVTDLVGVVHQTLSRTLRSVLHYMREDSRHSWPTNWDDVLFDLIA